MITTYILHGCHSAGQHQYRCNENSSCTGSQCESSREISVLQEPVPLQLHSSPTHPVGCSKMRRAIRMEQKHRVAFPFSCCCSGFPFPCLTGGSCSTLPLVPCCTAGWAKGVSLSNRLKQERKRWKVTDVVRQEQKVCRGCRRGVRR